MNICAAYNELINIGIMISNEDYTSVIIRSLPKSYSNYISHLSAAAHLLGKTMVPETIMTYLLEEYDRQLTLRPKGEKLEDRNQALAAYPAGKAKWQR